MARKTRYNQAKRAINNFFNNSENKTFSRNEIEGILFNEGGNWKLPTSFTTKKFISRLVNDEILEEYFIEFDEKKYTRWCLPNTPMLTRVSKVRKNQYFSHYTAVVAHSLTQQLPKSYYINQQLSPKNQPRGTLTQGSIDSALSKPYRQTSMIGYYMKKPTYGRFIYLQSKASGDTGIIKLPFDGVEINVTNLERTLLDITVSPEIAGGVFQVLEAYRIAAKDTSINKLLAYLKKLNYIYPYHQRIGFYMERCGVYSDSQIQQVKKIDQVFKFHLTHEIQEAEYSSNWKLYYPKEI